MIQKIKKGTNFCIIGNKLKTLKILLFESIFGKGGNTLN